MTQDDINQKILDELTDIKKMVLPMYNVYQSLQWLGKATGWILGTVSVAVGLALGVRSLFKR